MLNSSYQWIFDIMTYDEAFIAILKINGKMLQQVQDDDGSLEYVLEFF